MARVVLGASGAVCAFATLLPGLMVALIALLDFGAHGLLGLSGTLLGFALPSLGGQGGLPAYRGVELDPARTAALSALRSLPPIGMIVIALLRPRQWATATLCSLSSCLTAGWFAIPGLLACAALAR